MNLLSNAAKFTSVVRSLCKAGKETMGICHSGAGYGIGMTQSINGLLPFVQGDSSITRRFEAPVLGCPLSRAWLT